MSDSSDSGPSEDPVYSPETSPVKYSPATSPTHHDCSDSDSSEPPTRKRKQYGMNSEVSRSTIRRKLLKETRQASTSETSTEDYGIDECQEENFIVVGGNGIQEAEKQMDLSTDIESSSDGSIETETDHSDSEQSDNNQSIVSDSSDDLSDDSSDPPDDEDSLYGTSVKTTESVLQLLKLYVEERWTKKSLSKTLDVMKKMLPQPNSMPGSLKSLLRYLQNLTNVRQESEHYYCSQCQTPKITKDEVCPKPECIDKGKTGTFFQFSTDDQVKHMFEHRNLAAAVEFYHGQSSSGNDICDIRDGSQYKRVVSSLKGAFDVILVWNTDGVALSGSSNQELWPVLAFVSNVPPRLRSSYIVVSGIYVGPKKPVMNMFLNPLVESMQKNFEKGGITWVHPITKENVKSVIVMPILVADAPAKAACLNIMQFNAVYGCGVCEQKAGKVQTTFCRAGSPTVRRRARRCFLYQEEPARIRTTERMTLQALAAKRQNKPVRGVIRESVISNMPLLDLGVCASAEYMHNCMLGAVKYVLDLIVNVPGPWSISHKISEIDYFMANCIKVPDFIRRLPRCSIKELQKANEYRSFLLFYSLPIFENNLKTEYFQHWMLLVISMHILLSEKITKEDLKAAEIMLRCFVRDFANLYGEKYCTYNIHNLLHYSLLVERWGPLWATSAFIFEDYNGFLKNHIFGSKHYARELLNNLQIIQSVTILENIVEGRQFSFVSNDLKKTSVNFSSRLKYESLSDNEKKAISAVSKEVFLYKRAEISCQVYTSIYYDCNKKRSNSIVKYSQNNNIKYGQILFFVETDPVMVVIREFNIDNLHIFFHEESRFRVKNIVPVVATDLIDTCPIENLIQKLLQVGRYVCMIPNYFEINL